VEASFTVTDDQGATSSNTLTITVTGTNDAPVAVADSSTAREKSGLENALAGFDATGNALTNDTDVDVVDTRTVVSIQAGTGSGTTSVVPADSTGDAGYVAVSGMYGTLRIGADGSYRYLVDEDNATVQALRTAGDTVQDVFSYTVQDGQGATASSTVTITVEGANDAPTLVRVSNLAVTELTGATPNTASVVNVGSLTTDDPDDGETFVYDIIGGAQQFYFQIGTVDGVQMLQLRQGVPLNAEFLSEYSVVVRSTDALGLSTFETFVLQVGDVNEFGVTAPTFNVQPMAIGLDPNTVPENSEVDSFIGVTATAVDADATTNTVTYTLVGNAMGGAYTAGEFRIDAADGKVYVAGPIDREVGGGSRTLFVKATSSDGSSAIRSLNLFIADENEHAVSAPVDANVAANTVAENAPMGLNVGVTASASDADATTNTVTYSLVGDAQGLTAYTAGEFVIGSTNGVVTVDGPIDREAGGATRTLYIKAVSLDGSTAISSVTVNVSDVNEFAPVFSSGAAGSVNENAATSTVIYQAASSDADATAVVSYSLSGADAALLNINASTGAVTLKASADYEAKPSYSFNVVANDGANSTAQAVLVSVGNLNDNAPVFTSGATGSVNENAATSTVIYTAATTDADNLAARTYSLSGTDAALLNINASTGAVTLKASADYEAKPSYSFNVVAHDGANSTTQAVVVSVGNVDEPVTGSLAVVGVAALNQTLSVQSTLSDPDGMTALSYQWLADGVPITGATSAELLLGTALVGKAISAQVSYTDGTGALVNVASVGATDKVNAVDPSHEAEVPGLPDGDGNVVSGDGNGDGVADAQQDAVASIAASLSSSGGSGEPTSTYLSLVATDPAAHGGGSTANTGAVITSFEQTDAPDGLPANVSMPLGSISFSAQTIGNGESGETLAVPATFSLYVDKDLDINGFWVTDADGVLYNLATAVNGGQIVEEGGKLRVDFTIPEGSDLYADMVHDGVLTVTGALGHVNDGISGVVPAPTTTAFWF
jgi:VCBS repeat-containing protein